MFLSVCERTKRSVMRSALQLYFHVLSLRSTSNAIEPFVDKSYVAIRDWVQRFNPKHDIYPFKNNNCNPYRSNSNKDRQHRRNMALDGYRTITTQKNSWRLHIKIQKYACYRSFSEITLIQFYGKHIVYSDGGA